MGLYRLICWNCGFEYRRGAWISVSCECYVLSGRVLRLADHSSRGVLPNMVCLRVIAINKETLAHYGLLRQGGNQPKWEHELMRPNVQPLTHNNQTQFSLCSPLSQTRHSVRKIQFHSVFIKINHYFTTKFIMSFPATGFEAKFVRNVRYNVHVTRCTTAYLRHSHYACLPTYRQGYDLLYDYAVSHVWQL